MSPTGLVVNSGGSANATENALARKGFTSGTGAGSASAADARYENVVLSGEEMLRICSAAGWKGQQLAIALAVAKGESSWRPHKPNFSDPRNHSYGLFQINMPDTYAALRRKQFGLLANEELFNPETNARVAYQLSKGGAYWLPWAAYTGPDGKGSDGPYLRYMTEALRLVSGISNGTQLAGGTFGNDIVLSADWSNGDILTLNVGISAPPGNGKRLVRGTLDASTKQPSELDLEFYDENLDLLLSQNITMATRIRYGKDIFTVISVEVIEGPAGPHVSVKALPSGIVSLMHAEATVQVGRAIDYISTGALKVGLNLQSDSALQLAGGAVDGTITPDTTTANIYSALNPYITRPDPPLGPTGAATATRYITVWDEIKQIADGNGCDVWQAENSLYVTNPGTLIGALSTGDLVVSWLGQPGPVQRGSIRAIGVPTIAFEDIKRKKFTKVSGTFAIPAEYKDRLRLGMNVELGLVPLVGTDLKFRLTNYRVNVGDVVTPIECQFEAVIQAYGDFNAGLAAFGAQTTNPAAATTPSGKALAGSRTAESFVAYALAQKGKPYIFGAEARLTDPSPNAFDCSELVQWAGYQDGLTIPDGSGNQKAFCTPISMARAIGIKGALLFIGNPVHHVAISLGDKARTIEAKGRAYGVLIDKSTGRFDSAGLIPGMKF